MIAICYNGSILGVEQHSDIFRSNTIKSTAIFLSPKSDSESKMGQENKGVGAQYMVHRCHVSCDFPEVRYQLCISI